MTPRQIQIIRQSFAAIEQQAETISGNFYTRLFALHPALRRMFSDDLSEQEKKPMQMLRFAVALLEKPDAHLPVLDSTNGFQAFQFGLATDRIFHISD